MPCEQRRWADGVFDGTGPLSDFETFTFGPSFSDLLRIQISPGIMIDNVQITPIPEPSVGLLLTFTVVALSAWALRRSPKRWTNEILRSRSGLDPTLLTSAPET